MMGEKCHFRVKLKPQTNGVWFRGWWRKASAGRLKSNRNHPVLSRASSTSESNLRNWDQLFRTFRTEKLFINSKMNCRVFSTPTFYISPRFSTGHHLFLIRCDLPQHIYWLVLSRWPEKPFLSCETKKMFHNKSQTNYWVIFCSYFPARLPLRSQILNLEDKYFCGKYL